MPKRTKADPQGDKVLARRFESEAMLLGLLKEAGSPLTFAEVQDFIRDAQAAGMGADEALPDLFDEEPRFASPDGARRLYANLFGLWDRLAGNSHREPPPDPTAVPGPIEGPLTDEFVEAAWRYLDALPSREGERWIHRWQNTQPDLGELLQAHGAGDDAVLDNADTLCFEVWAMIELARPKKHRRALSFEELEAALVSTDSPEPALERYIDEAAEEAMAADPPLTEEQAAKVSRLARAAVRALVKAG